MAGPSGTARRGPRHASCRRSSRPACTPRGRRGDRSGPRRRYVPRAPFAPTVAEPAAQRELVAVREIVHAFLRADRPEDVFQFALDRVSPVVGASFASVYLVDGASELMRLLAPHSL